MSNYPFILCLLAIWIHLYYNDLIRYYYKFFPKAFTIDELSKYNGINNSNQIYISILGNVFDVSSSPQFYGESQSYHYFAGTDATQSFVTGDNPNSNSLISSSLKPVEIKVIFDWLNFYKNHNQYIYIGYLIGTYYNKSGQYTNETKKIFELYNEYLQIAATNEILLKQFPRCNTKWNQIDGGKIWCDILESENIQRKPRQFLDEQKNTMCMCTSK